MRILLLFLYLFSSTVNAQINLDSLWVRWEDESISDSSRLEAHGLFIREIIQINPDSAFYLAGENKKFADSLSDYYHSSLASHLQGSVLSMKSQYRTALAYFLESYGLIRKHDLPRDELSILSNIGRCYQELGLVDTAIRTYNIALERVNVNTPKIDIANCYNNLGNIYKNQGLFMESAKMHEKSLTIKKEIGSKRGMAFTYGNLGNLYKRMGLYQKSIIYYKNSLNLMKEINFQRGIGMCYYNLSNAYEQVDSMDKHFQYLNLSLDLSLETGDKRTAGHTLVSIASSHLKAMEFDRSIEKYQDAISIFRESEDYTGHAIALNGLAFVEYYRSNFKAAKELSKKAIAMLTDLKEVLVIENSQTLMYRIAILEDSTKLALKYLNPILEMRIRDLEINIPVLSENEKEQFFVSIEGDFSRLKELSLMLRKTEPSILDRTFNYELRTKGLLLKSSTAMRQSILQSKDTVLIETYNKWINLRKLIAQKYAKRQNSKKEEENAHELERYLIKTSGEFSDVKKASDMDWKDVRSGLKDQETAVEIIQYWQGDDLKNERNEKKKIYAALIVNNKSEHPKMVRLFEEAQLEKILGTFPGNNLSYIEQVYGSKENTKSQLYDLIWKPIEEELEGAKKVYISPVGLLHKISFAALAKEQDVFLCDLYNIEMKSSTGKLAMPSEVAYNESSTTTLFGGIDYNSDSTTFEIWNYLDGSLSETQQIEKVLKKGNREYNYFSQKEATEAQFKEIASNSNILHIATHGFFYADPDLVFEESVDEKESEADLVFRGGRTGMGMNTFVKSRNPLMRSGLAFAGANDVWNRTNIEGEDGVLTAAEVATIDMRNTDLVVLSACETGLGDIKGSEGVYGLQRSFKMAGVKYLIMSLWQVPDKETAEFMTTFYKNLTKTNDIKESFNSTQKEMREKYDPYYWAAFVLVE